MARINSYTRDKNITTEDTLIGSSFEGNSQSGPVYTTQSYKVGDLAKYLNLVFTVDEVNYNLNDMILRIDALENANNNFQGQIDLINNHLNPNFVITTDVNNSISTLKTLGGTIIDPTFTVSSFGMWDSVAGQRVQPFEIINNVVKVKREHLQFSWQDLDDPPLIEYNTTVYADDINGNNQSLTRGTKNFYGIYTSTSKITESDLPVTGVTWFQITGDPGESAAAVFLTANPEQPVILHGLDGQDPYNFVFTVTPYNVSGMVVTYRWTVNGTVVQESASTTYSMPDSLEPYVNETINVKVQLLNNGTPVAGVEDNFSITGLLEDSNQVFFGITNPYDAVICDSDGNPVDPNFTNNIGSSYVFLGIEDITSQCTFSVFSETGVDVTINVNTGDYFVNSMSAEQGRAVLRATIPASAIPTSSVDITRDVTYLINKNIKGDTGDNGTPGTDGRTVKILPSTDTLKYDEYGDLEPNQTLSFTADSTGYTYPEYRWLKDDIELTNYPQSGRTVEWTTSNTYTVPSGATTLLPPAYQTDKWTVEAREGSLMSTISRDVETVGAVQKNSNIYYIEQTNQTASFTTSAAGNVNTSGGENSIRVFKGSTLLDYVANPSTDTNGDYILLEGEFTIDITGTNIDPSTTTSWNATTKVFSIAAPNGTTMTADNAHLDFTITAYKRPEHFVGTIRQSFSKSSQGPIGDTGPDGPRIATGVIWYEDGSATDPLNGFAPGTQDTSGRDIVWDFNDNRFEALEGSPLTPTSPSLPPGFQEDSPEGVPGTADAVYWTSRFTAAELTDSNGVGLGYSDTPVFQPLVRAMVFNQVVVFESNAPNQGYTQIDGGFIKTVQIRSLNYVPPLSGQDFAQDGMLIDLQNKEIISTNLVLSADANGTTSLKIDGDGTFTGSLTGASGTFGPVTINTAGISSTNFSISSTGNVTFNGSGNFTGNITAAGGTIGGWDIAGDALYTGTKVGNGVFAAQGDITIGSSGYISASQFRIDQNGNAYFKGDISGANLGSNMSFGSGGTVDINGYVVDTTGNFGNYTGGSLRFIDSNSNSYASIYGVRNYYGGTPTLPQFDDYIYLDADITKTSNNLTVQGNLLVEGSITEQTPTQSLTGSGYVKLPSGLIIQWVSTSGVTSNASGPGPNGTWPIAFPNACFGAVASKGENQGTVTLSGIPTFVSDQNAITVSYSKNKWHVDTNEGASRDFTIIAIGF